MFFQDNFLSWKATEAGTWYEAEAETSQYITPNESGEPRPSHR